MRSSTVSKATTRVKPQMPSGKESLQLVPSSAFQKPRCQSASAVRKKLFHAVEQGCTNSYQHPNHKLQSQIDALRNLATASFSKTPMKAVKGYRTLTADSSIHQGMTSISRKNSGVSIPVNKTQNQEECIAGVGICPSQSASASILMSNNAQQPANPVYPSQSVLVGGYRSSSVQLEVELVERLNEIRRSNVRMLTRICSRPLSS
ncbi:unnamed protein product [Phytophthora lilii]|uniref:Unnamed protein product n=1 Tax=Phytophthora lilii TaxID=2077276 RepID=A0A9W6WP55_9STRA|nr:unnamed protein product [Phytophthora lilii]